ncbi:MAG: alpha-L-fucosidase, partial [Cellulosilyticaceae bacterium]
MWYKKDYRRVFMDMHLNDSNEEEYLSKLDVASFVDTLSGAHVNNVVVKAKSHVGLHYWPSQYGKMHAGLKRRNLDYVGEMIKACRAADISVTVYFSQVYDNYAYDEHPTWRLVSGNGVTSREHGGRYGHVCPNNMEYRAYGKEILEELLDLYDFDGMFLDMPFWPDVCYCASCRERFIKETGHDIPRGAGLDNEIWVDFLKRRQEWLEEYVSFNSQVIKAKKLHVSIEHNFAAVGVGWAPGDTEKILDACDYAGGDYYG